MKKGLNMNRVERRLSPRFDAALVMVAQLHADQFRKGSDIPYISHLLATAALVLEFGGSEDEAIAALLHDAVEDQGGAVILERIRNHFGDIVADTVDQCSDTDVIPKPPWRERKEQYLAALSHKSPSAILVSLADKVHNASCILRDYKNIGDDLWQRFNGGKDGTLWYYWTLVGIYRKHADSDLVSELEAIVSELKSLAR
jgi:(p)ppGpp synthase/HD superfamily hydrolase